jgi:hypothetical protein
MMTQQERNRRRALIVRRWTAHRVGRAQREIWKKRRASAGRGLDEDIDVVGEDDLLADLPEGLVG